MHSTPYSRPAITRRSPIRNEYFVFSWTQSPRLRNRLYSTSTLQPRPAVEPFPTSRSSYSTPPRPSFISWLTSAFCRTVLSAERRGVGVGQQRAVRHHPGPPAPCPLRPVADVPVLASERAEAHLRSPHG